MKTKLLNKIIKKLSTNKLSLESSNGLFKQGLEVEPKSLFLGHIIYVSEYDIVRIEIPALFEEAILLPADPALGVKVGDQVIVSNADGYYKILEIANDVNTPDTIKVFNPDAGVPEDELFEEKLSKEELPEGDYYLNNVIINKEEGDKVFNVNETGVRIGDCVLNLFSFASKISLLKNYIVSESKGFVNFLKNNSFWEKIIQTDKSHYHTKIKKNNNQIYYIHLSGEVDAGIKEISIAFNFYLDTKNLLDLELYLGDVVDNIEEIKIKKASNFSIDDTTRTIKINNDIELNKDIIGDAQGFINSDFFLKKDLVVTLQNKKSFIVNGFICIDAFGKRISYFKNDISISENNVLFASNNNIEITDHKKSVWQTSNEDYHKPYNANSVEIKTNYTQYFAKFYGDVTQEERKRTNIKRRNLTEEYEDNTQDCIIEPKASIKYFNVSKEFVTSSNLGRYNKDTSAKWGISIINKDYEFAINQKNSSFMMQMKDNEKQERKEFILEGNNIIFSGFKKFILEDIKSIYANNSELIIKNISLKDITIANSFQMIAREKGRFNIEANKVNINSFSEIIMIANNGGIRLNSDKEISLYSSVLDDKGLSSNSSIRVSSSSIAIVSTNKIYIYPKD